MKKITVTGQRVHEVGYRVFLLWRAKALRFQKFDAYNAYKKDLQVVVATVEGDEKRISAFKHIVENEEPEGAEITGRSVEDYDGEIGSISNFSQDAILEQLDKGIPALLRMDRKMDQMLEKQDQMIDMQDAAVDELRDLHEDLVRRDQGERLIRMEKDVKTIKGKLRVH